jgi:hypothetical protein
VAAEWIAPLATAVVGIAGIAGTAHSTRSQRRTQLELLGAQQARQDRVDLLAQKRAAFVEFLDRYRAVIDSARRLAKADNVEASGRIDSLRELRERQAALDAARNRLWLSSSVYTVYYADGMLGHAAALVEAATHGRGLSDGVIAAEHKVYHLMGVCCTDR